MSNCFNEPIKTNSVSYGITPLSVDEEKCAPLHSWGAGVRNHYLIHYVISGKGTFYCGTNKYTVKSGQIFVIIPNTIVKYQADEHNPWHYIWATFTGDEVKEIFNSVGISNLNPVITLTNGAEVLQLLRSMPKERSSDLAENMRFKSQLYDFMSLLVASFKSNEKQQNSYYDIAVRYIKSHFFEELSVDEISAFIGISRKYLYALFKKECGKSPKDYIVDYRIKKACELLKRNDLTISNIAFSVGYRDPLTFSKIFKQKTGLSPTDYKNNN